MFKSITIFSRPGEATVIGSWVLNTVVEWVGNKDIPVRHYVKGLDHKVYEDSLFVAIGGDGTMLRAMDVSIKANIKHNANTSVVGFNAGNLGFLTEDPDNVDPKFMLDQIYNDSSAVRCDERLALMTTVNGEDHYAINEFTFTPRNVAAPLIYQISINGMFVAKHMGGGCMVSTPTGSTAMAMSAGGSIIVPTANVMQVVPIIPHTLSSRPVITADFDSITITSDMDRIDEVIVSSDGREIITFTADAELTVTKAEQPVKVWYSSRREFFNVLSTKLDW